MTVAAIEATPLPSGPVAVAGETAAPGFGPLLAAAMPVDVTALPIPLPQGHRGVETTLSIVPVGDTPDAGAPELAVRRGARGQQPPPRAPLSNAQPEDFGIAAGRQRLPRHAVASPAPVTPAQSAMAPAAGIATAEGGPDDALALAMPMTAEGPAAEDRAAAPAATPAARAASMVTGEELPADRALRATGRRPMVPDVASTRRARESETGTALEGASADAVPVAAAFAPAPPGPAPAPADTATRPAAVARYSAAEPLDIDGPAPAIPPLAEALLPSATPAAVAPDDSRRAASKVVAVPNEAVPAALPAQRSFLPVAAPPAIALPAAVPAGRAPVPPMDVASASPPARDLLPITVAQPPGAGQVAAKLAPAATPLAASAAPPRPVPRAPAIAAPRDRDNAVPVALADPSWLRQPAVAMPAAAAVADPAPLRAPDPAPPVDMTVTSARLGAVRIGIDGSAGDLRLSLGLSPEAAAIVAADTPRLFADLAASGVRVQALDLSGVTSTATAQNSYASGSAGSFMGAGDGQSPPRGAPPPAPASPPPSRDTPPPPAATSRPRPADRYA